MLKWLECHQHLLNGDYDDHWPRHEWIRTGSPEFKDSYQSTPSFGKPIWGGLVEPITLLVNADFGMGDTIHFWRFISQVRRRVSKLFLRCDEDFKTLFDVEIIGKNEPLPEFDKIIHMMALPHVLDIKKTDLSGEAYLVPNLDKPMDEDFCKFLSTCKSTKVGVCWQGNPFNPRDNIRSVPELSSCFDSTCGFFCLNKIGDVPSNYFDLKAYLTDWNVTAHLVSLLDLVITVDTAIAHLAGALGVPTWLILSNEDLDWRWGREGSSTLWYDSVRIFRRQTDWHEVLCRVRNDLLAL